MAKQTRLWVTIVIIILVVIAVLLILFAQSPTGRTLKVGVLTPLAGPAAPYGENILAGVECAKEAINDAGGINGRLIELVVETSDCNGAKAVTAATKLVDVDGVIGIVGQACSAATIPVAALTEDKKFVLIASAASNPAVTESPYVFRVNPNDLAQSQGISDYLIEQSVNSIAILALNDEYGAGLIEEFEKRFIEKGGEVVATELFSVDATDYRTQITKLEEAEFETLFIIANPTQHPQIAKQLEELGKDWDRIAEFNFGVTPAESTNEAMDGTVYPTSSFDAAANANARTLDICMQAQGKQADIVTAWGSDALDVFAEAAKKCSTISGDCVKDNLVGLQFDGASGSNRFTAQGEIEQPPFEFVVFEQ